MNKWKFRKLFEVLQNRVKEDGKKTPAWFLGFVEGLGDRKLTGNQIGALVDLLLVPNVEEVSSEVMAELLPAIDEQNVPDMEFLRKLS